MKNNRRNLYDLDFDEHEERSDSRRTKRKSSKQARSSRSRAYTDTDTIYDNSESGEPTRRNRRDNTNENHYVSSGSRRSSHTSSMMTDDEREELFRRKKKARAEAARWKRAHWIVRFLIVLVLILDILFLRFGVFKGGFMPVWNILTSGSNHTESSQPQELQITEQFLTQNEYSRPGTPLEAVNGIVIHFTGNPNADGQANRDYFENLKDGVMGSDGKPIYGSCNYIVGLDGSVIHCVPDNEVAYASADRNYYTLSIEYCHPDESGAMTAETFQALVKLTAKLCKENNLSVDQVIRHYDINGRNCPRYFVEDPDSWSNFIESVKSCM